MLWVLIRIALPRRLDAEAILMCTHNIGFYEEMLKIIFQLSSNMHLISSFVLTFSDILAMENLVKS